MRWLLASCLTAGALPSCASSPASEPPAEESSPVLARVFGELISLADVEASPPYFERGRELSAEEQFVDRKHRLEALLWDRLLEDLRRRHGIEVRREEEDELLAAFGVDPESADSMVEGRWGNVRSLAHEGVLRWKTGKLLYETYGGRVQWQQLDPQEPIGAYRAFWSQAEARGDLWLADGPLRDSIRRTQKANTGFLIEPADVDFDVPWWKRLTP